MHSTVWSYHRETVITIALSFGLSNMLRALHTCSLFPWEGPSIVGCNCTLWEGGVEVSGRWGGGGGRMGGGGGGCRMGGGGEIQSNGHKSNIHGGNQYMHKILHD